MTSSPRPSQVPSQEPAPRQTTTSPVLVIFGTALDTTWRIFVPTIGGALLGMLIDSQAASSPLWAIILLIAGMGVSGFLIVKQLSRVKGDA